jgi:transposase
MLYAAIDIHKHVFQAAVLDPETGEITEARFPATREDLAAWAGQWDDALAGVAVEATCGWRWVCRELVQRGVEVRLAEPGQTLALKGRRRRAKTDRLDAGWMAMLLARGMLPTAWLAPEDIGRLRDLTRLRQSLRHDRTRWAQRLHGILTHEGWPCSRRTLLTTSGRRWLEGLTLDTHARGIVDAHLVMIHAIEDQMRVVERELNQLAKTDPRLVALQTIYGIGPIIACHLLAEIGDASRFRRSRQIVRVAGLDPVVMESADTKRRGRLSRQGSPHLRWALVQAAQQAARRPGHPDRELYDSVKERIGSQRATLTTARKIARRAYHVLNELDQAA